MTQRHEVTLPSGAVVQFEGPTWVWWEQFGHGDDLAMISALVRKADGADVKGWKAGSVEDGIAMTVVLSQFMATRDEQLAALASLRQTAAKTWVCEVATGDALKPTIPVEFREPLVADVEDAAQAGDRFARSAAKSEDRDAMQRHGETVYYPRALVRSIDGVPITSAPTVADAKAWPLSLRATQLVQACIQTRMALTPAKADAVVRSLRVVEG